MCMGRTTPARIATYSSEMSMLNWSWLIPVRWSLVMISIRWSLLSRKSPLLAEAVPCGIWRVLPLGETETGNKNKNTPTTTTTHTHILFFFDMKVLLCHLKAAPIHGVDTHQHQPLMDTACSKVRHYTSTAAWPCSHLFESEGKETIVLRADWDTADVGQRDAGFNLTGLLVGQDNIFLRQQEDPGCSLNCDHDRYYLTICKL